MLKKNKKAQQSAKPQAGDVQAIRIGTRVRCTDDGVEGRITWANAVSVKIKWDDGEEVTWRRDALADKPIEFLDDQQADETTATPDAGIQVIPAEQTDAEQARTAPAPTEEAPTAEPPVPDAPQVAEHPVESATTTADATSPPIAETEVNGAEQPSDEPVATADTPSVSAPAKPKRTRQPKKAAGDAGPKKLSAIDAAAKVLEETGQPMSCQEMIDAMAAKGYWVSPGGKTPAATLYSSVLRELQTKGDNARFRKTDRGKFAFHRTA